jgi:hypothetical protein
MSRTLKLNASQFTKPMVSKIYVQFYCVIKYDVQNKAILDISISKLNFVQKNLNLSNFNFLYINLVLDVSKLS